MPAPLSSRTDPTASGPSVEELQRGLGTVPALDQVEATAAAMRNMWGQSATRRLDLESALLASEADSKITELGAAEGGTQGLLMPLDRGGFAIAVDPAPGPEDFVVSPFLQKARRQRGRFLIAHELAHTIFYRRKPSGGGAPARLAFDSSAQERFCDRLAAALLLPPSVARKAARQASSVAALQRRFDVEALLALRSLMDVSAGVAAWLIADPEGEDPFVRWGSEATGQAIEPWPALTRLLARARRDSEARCKLGWRNGATTMADGHYLRRQRLLVVIARVP